MNAPAYTVVSTSEVDTVACSKKLSTAESRQHQNCGVDPLEAMPKVRFCVSGTMIPETRFMQLLLAQ